jgi:hypothetical protein
LKLADTTRTGLGNGNLSTHVCCGLVVSLEPWRVLPRYFDINPWRSRLLKNARCSDLTA